MDGVTYKVTQIADGACKNNAKLTSVTIGKNVTKIGKNAFAGCKKLKSVTIGKNVTKISASAFSKCKKLKTITIKSTKLKSIGKKAFANISSKATIKVPKKYYKKYKKLLKASTGYKKTMTIKKI